MPSAMLYNIKDERLKYWRNYDELGDRNDFAFESSACACGFAGQKLVANTTRHRQEFPIVQCLNCGTLRIEPYLTAESIDKYYSETYGKIKRQDALAEKLWKKQAKASRLVFSLVSPFVTKQSKILDFGGATGGKMQELMEQGYDVSLKDLDQKYFEYGVSRGLKAFDENVKYDFVVLARVLEHMSGPVEFLHYLKTLVAPAGLIYIEVPLIENARDGYLLNEFHIAHKFYFTDLSLKNVCAIAGLTPVHVSRNLLIVKMDDAAEHLSRKKMMKLSNRVLFKAMLMKHVMRLGLKPEGKAKN